MKSEASGTGGGEHAEGSPCHRLRTCQPLVLHIVQVCLSDVEWAVSQLRLEARGIPRANAPASGPLAMRRHWDRRELDG